MGGAGRGRAGRHVPWSTCRLMSLILCLMKRAAFLRCVLLRVWYPGGYPEGAGYPLAVLRSLAALAVRLS